MTSRKTMLRDWYFQEARWWQFWRPQSGLSGGLIILAIETVGFFLTRAIL